MGSLTRRSFVALAATSAFTALAGCAPGGSGFASAKAPSPSSSSSSASATRQDGTLRLMTGGEAGTYYALGSAMAKHCTDNTDVAVKALFGSGSQSNVMELAEGNADLAFCQSDVLACAYDGTNLFDGAPVDGLSVVAALYDEPVQIVTCDPEIETVADLKGRSVSIGAVGSGVYFNAIDILGAYGLAETDVNPTYQSFGDSVESLKDGRIDAAFIVAGAPTAAVAALADSKQAYLVALDSAHVAALLAASPYYSEAIIEKGTYAGIGEDVATVSVTAVIIANDAAPEDELYAFVSDIFDNAADLASNDAYRVELSIDKGASAASVPYHPGAARYFAERGRQVAIK